MIALGFKPDRKIDRLYAVIATDPASGLQGLCSVGFAGVDTVQMQAVASTWVVAERMKEQIVSEESAAQYEIRVVEFLPVVK